MCRFIKYIVLYASFCAPYKLDHKAYSDTQYMKYAISVSELENMTGFTFFPSLPSEVKKTLNTSQWN